MRISSLLVEPAELELEIDQPDADAEEQAGQEIVDPERHLHDLVEVLGARPAEGGDVLLATPSGRPARRSCSSTR